jgi:hypothetical protein
MNFLHNIYARLMPNLAIPKSIDITGFPGLGLKAPFQDRHFFMTLFFKNLLYRGFLPSSIDDASVTFL